MVGKRATYPHWILQLPIIVTLNRIAANRRYDQRLVVRKLREQWRRNGSCARIVEKWPGLQPLLTHSKFSGFVIVGRPNPIPLPSPKPFADTDLYRLVFPVAKNCGDSLVPI